MVFFFFFVENIENRRTDRNGMSNKRTLKTKRKKELPPDSSTGRLWLAGGGGGECYKTVENKTVANCVLVENVLADP